jgi:hypothetical protein
MIRYHPWLFGPGRIGSHRRLFSRAHPTVTAPKPFICPNNLDQRIDHELVRAFEEAKFALQGAFEKGRLAMHIRQDDGPPAEV